MSYCQMNSSVNGPAKIKNMAQYTDAEFTVNVTRHCLRRQAMLTAAPIANTMMHVAVLIRFIKSSSMEPICIPENVAVTPQKNACSHDRLECALIAQTKSAKTIATRVKITALCA